ncbi:MAG: hypothetical protein NC180_13070 [Muribaculaceae bacterium]|nr:hypothetical protein [Muribaculaceae bacterium]
MLLGQLSEKNKKLFLQLEMLLANIDGNFSASEKVLIEKHCREMGIDPADYNVNISLDETVNDIYENMSVKEKKIIFIELITLAVIDGVYDDKEKELVDSLRKMLGMPEEVGNQALQLVERLVKVSAEIENFVEW